MLLRGSQAFSDSRLQALRQNLTSAGLPIASLSAAFAHLVVISEPQKGLSSEQRSVLEQILTYGPTRSAAEISGLLRIVAPRPGTISPWSSKATDIAHLCGLEAVERIERVIVYTLDIGTESLTHAQLTKSILKSALNSSVPVSCLINLA